jgi:hypothetical protein
MAFSRPKLTIEADIAAMLRNSPHSPKSVAEYMAGVRNKQIIGKILVITWLNNRMALSLTNLLL